MLEHILNKEIDAVCEKLGPDSKAAKLFRNCYPNTLATTTNPGEDGRYFVFTGDIPAFEKNPDHRVLERERLYKWVETFPEPAKSEWLALYGEMEEMATDEARLYKALDNLEAVIQHNESDISTWLPLEYDLQLTYGADKVGFSPYLQSLKADIDDWTRRKIAEEGNR